MSTEGCWSVYKNLGTNGQEDVKQDVFVVHDLQMPFMKQWG